ncbi:M48 family metallopeptidase [Actibacterium ureilyticum]|uniref:M48 family metallopeptidase n=1 Tax=Actibacterium ureilyticum TaxID=1590614 RepID=UPI000BAB027B|nr:M48 family metallopeptidase [Actibacterium ureilyticum]
MPISKGSMSGFPSDPGTPVPGHAYGPGSSRRIAASLRVADDQATLFGPQGERLVVGHARRRDRIGAGPSLIDIDDGWRFETDAHEMIDTLLGHEQKAGLMEYERFHPRLVLVVLACFAGVFLIWRFGLGVLVAIGIALTPAPFVSAIDRGNIAAIDRVFAQPSRLDADRRAEVRAIFDDLAQAAPEPPYGDYQLHFRHIPRLGANAFALPGGNIVMTDAFVRQFGDDDIIAAVLGHEMAHVTEKHSLQQLYRSLSIYLLIALIAGDVGPVAEDILLEGGALMSLAYSREHESEADAIGIRVAARAGYDPAALAVFFRRLDGMTGGGDGPQWYSTHPASRDRAAEIRRQIEELGLSAD